MIRNIQKNSIWLFLCVAPLAYAQPVINSGGVTNGASFVSSNLPGGALAQGSIFSIKGERLGPGDASNYLTGVTAGALPFQTALGGVSVNVTGGGRTVAAYIQFAWTSQINAILPSNAPTGDVQVTVTYNGQTSAPASARVVPSNFGIFSTAGGRGPGIVQNFVGQNNTPLNNAAVTARPGQTVILWGTGLGPISAPDNAAPPVGDLPVDVAITVGGKPVTVKRYAGRSPEFPGLDQVVFDVPNDAPEGCYVPVQVRTGNTFSNFVSMAINKDGARCSDAQNPLSNLNRTGGKFGSIILARLDLAIPDTALKFDIGTASFDEVPNLGDFSYNQFASLPPINGCSVFTTDDSTTDLLSSDATDVYAGKPLDAGAAIILNGPGDLGTRRIEKADPTAAASSYFGLIGGALPLPGQTPQPLFLNGGTYAINNGTGGTDVKAFNTNVTLPAEMIWTNRGDTNTVTRASGVTLNWTGGGSDRTALIVGTSSTADSSASAVFICFAPASAGTFTVPASILSSLPASGSPEELGGILGLVALPTGQVPTFTAQGLDQGTIVSVSASIKALEYK